MGKPDVSTIVLRPAPTVPGEWVGHCLELDVVSQGRSSSHALEMTVEACHMVVLADAQNNRDSSLRRAPDSYWHEANEFSANSVVIGGLDEIRGVDGGGRQIRAIVMTMVNEAPNPGALSWGR